MQSLLLDPNMCYIISIVILTLKVGVFGQDLEILYRVSLHTPLK